MPAHALAEITEDHAAAPLPDYQGGGIVNLMASIVGAFGGDPGFYPPLDALDGARLRAHRNIVLFVIDGLGYEWLKRAGPGSALFRHTVGPITSVFPSTTASAIT
ncbi:MAG: alkaline phosphatase family protein, partial [bacterium]